ncbi:MAG: dihydrodipicolinate synthase family protein [Acidimicrobiia bacterium]|nr:dihydrodipicolinate synthase family protein [Acidimicrobiia bacterium]
MRTKAIESSDWQGVFPVPPLARNASGAIDFQESEKIVRHIAAGGIRNFLYGGNAFLYHLTLKEYEALLEWLSGLDKEFFCIPSAGPSYGRAMDQAPLLAKYGFPCVMLLPCGDPRDAAGLERGYRTFAEAAKTPLIVYLKEESNFGNDRPAGLDAVGRLVKDGICVGIKYAVVRENPSEDAYLERLLHRVERAKVISGIGERPAIAHMRDFRLPGFTTGSGCVAPNLSRMLFELNKAGQWEAAGAVRQQFLGLEDLRDGWGPARVLHAATELAGIAATGPIAPYVSPIRKEQSEKLADVSKELAEADRKAAAVSV